MPRIAAALGVFLLVGAPLSQAAESAADYYKGKTITYVVATSPGGGYDTYGRLVTRYMNKYMPDSKIIVRNIPARGMSSAPIRSMRPSPMALPSARSTPA